MTGMPLHELPVVEGADVDLARRHMPVLRLDVDEPYRPLAMGFTVFRAAARSPSSKFDVVPKGAMTIEYAIWYDWDIQHLYDLEHVWVHLDEDGTVGSVEASFHGARVPMELVGGLPSMEGARPVLFVEPGKHAHWADGMAMAFRAGAKLRESCGQLAGNEGIHEGNAFFAAGAYSYCARADRLAKLKMQRDAFVPRFSFERTSDESDVALCPWSVLEDWIPERVKALIADLPSSVPHLSAVFLDCGDTLISEETEVKREGTEVVLSAEEIPHAMDAVRKLSDLGYPMVLVADGPRETFENVLKPRGIWDLMDAHVISGDVGELKPAPLMFETAMSYVAGDVSRVVMVGNNLARDIKGANAFGLQSLFVGWSKRRTHAATEPLEIPDARIDQLDHLVAAIAALELALPEAAHD